MKMLLDIADKYKVDVSCEANELIKILTQNVTVPMVGGFNTGKSSALNAILEQELLPTGNLPEECPPVEISYGENELLLCRHDTMQRVDLCALRDRSVPLGGINAIKLKVKNDFLKSVDNIVLVDLPGYDSGTELHDRWIQNYLLRCYAYILVVAADEPVVKHSIVELLLGYTTPNKPIFVVLTKCDKIPPTELRRCNEYIENTIKTYLPVNKIYIANAEVGVGRSTDRVKSLISQINSLIRLEQVQVLRRYCLGISYLLKTVVENELLTVDLPVPERQRLTEKQNVRFFKLKQGCESTLDELEDNVDKVLSKVRINIKSLTAQLQDPIISLIISSQDVNAFLAGIIPAYINKEVYSTVNPAFLASERSINAHLHLSGLSERFIEFDENDISPRVLVEAMSREEGFMSNVGTYAARINRKIKKEDGIRIVSELILPEIEQHIIGCIERVSARFLQDYIQSVREHVEHVSETKDRIINAISKPKSTDTVVDIEGIKQDLKSLNDYIDNIQTKGEYPTD